MWYSLVFPPITSIDETPSILDRYGFTIYSPIIFNSTWFLVSDCKEYPITGKMEGFIFSTVICTFGGKEFFICAILDSNLCLSTFISEPQSIKAEISQEPILVTLRMSLRFSTLFMAFSSGFVTVTIILSTGCCPLSAIIFILGKVTFGKSEVLKFL